MMVKLMTRHCSIPDIFNLRKWFEKNFCNACALHDALYANTHATRFDADYLLIHYMLFTTKDKSTRSKIIVYYPTILLTFVFVRCFGWKRYNEAKNERYIKTDRV